MHHQIYTGESHLQVLILWGKNFNRRGTDYLGSSVINDLFHLILISMIYFISSPLTHQYCLIMVGP